MKWVLVLLALSLLIIPASAGTFADAQLSAERINTALQQVTPYDRTLTMTNLATLGYDTANMTRPGTYRILIKSASYDPDTGLLSLNMWAWHNGASLQTHSPWHFYMPFPEGIGGTTAPQRINNFIKLLISNLEILPYGTPIGDDAETIYPSVDGRVYLDSQNLSYSDIRNAAAGGGHDHPATNSASSPALRAHASFEPNFQYLRRSIWVFNTSVIPSGTITSSLVSIRVAAKATALGTPAFDITGGTTISTSDLAVGDFDGWTGNIYSSTSYGSITTGARNNFSLNASGLTYIEQEGEGDGFTVFFGRDSWDTSGSFGGTWSAGSITSLTLYYSPYTGTDNDPFLYVEYTPGGCTPSTAAFGADDLDACTNQNITFTDSSSPEPDNWDWYFSSAVKGSDLQDPVYAFTTSGLKYVNLYVDNSSCPGPDWENKTDYISVDASPVAGYTVNETPVCTYEYVLFESTSTNAESWDWIFSDSTDCHTEDCTKYFDTAGNIWANLTADNSGCVADYSNQTLLHVDANVTADFTANQTSCTCPCTVAFTDTSTGGTVDDWAWDVDGDAVTEYTTQNAVHTYNAVGLYTVNLTVQNDGCSEFPDIESKVNYINVSGVCPTPTTTRPPTTVQTTVPGMYSPDTCGTCCEDGTSGQVWLAALMVIGVVVVFGVTRK